VIGIKHVVQNLAPALAIGVLALAIGTTAGSAFEIQGHRGARGLMPENTLPAFEAALVLGVDVLELDVAVTADDRLVVVHDLALNPATTRGPNGRWLRAPTPPVRSLTLQELRHFDVGRIDPGSDYARRYAEQAAVDGTQIPALEEVVDLTRRVGADKVRFNIETKLHPLSPHMTPPPERFAALLVEELRRLEIEERTMVQSFDWRTLQAVQKLAPDIPTVCLSAQQRWLDTLERGRTGRSPWLAGKDADDHRSVPDLVASAGCEIWSPYFKDLDGNDIARAHALGIEVVAWTVNEEDDMRRLIDDGVDGIITDYPPRLRSVLSDLGLPLASSVAKP
jgi:glycerophosphoryl diester phosphodiesterase